MLENIIKALDEGRHTEVVSMVEAVRKEKVELDFRANEWKLPYAAAKAGGEGGQAVLVLWLEQEKASTGVNDIPALVQQLLSGMGLDSDGIANVKAAGQQLQEQEQSAVMREAGITVSKKELFKTDDVEQFEKHINHAVEKGFDLQSLAPDAVRFGAVKIITFMCESSKTLSDNMLACFKECLASRNMHIASVILQAYPENDGLKQAMNERPHESGVLRVMKKWTTSSSKEYAAIMPIFEQYAKTYLSSLPGLLALGLPDNSVNVLPGFVAVSTTSLPGTSNAIGLAQDETKMALACSTAISTSQVTPAGQITQFSTQPAQFMECFIETAALQTLHQQIANAKAGIGAQGAGGHTH